MNIAFVNATRRWGGVKTWMLDFAESLSAKGQHIFIYGRQPAFIATARRRIGNGEIVRFGADLNPFSIRYFYSQFRQNAIDVVLINIEKDLATAGVAAKLLNIPVIQEIGLPTDIPYRFKTACLHRWIDPYFLSSSLFIETGFLKSLPYLNPAKSKVILSAKKKIPSKIEIHTPRRLIATQQLNKDKGHEIFLRALAEIKIPWECHIAGVGAEEENLKSLAKNLNISDRVIWHGFVENISDLLLQNDIFLLASLSEGLPNTLQEALAAGLLPVLRDVGGVREVLSLPLQKWILPYSANPQDFRSLIERALKLSDSDLLYLRQASRACRDQYFDLDKKTDDLINWLKSLIVK